MKFHYVFIPTLKCNLACPYCYQDHAGADMSPEVLAALKLHLQSRLQNGMDAMHAGFFGGEPLLRKATVLELAGFAKSRLEAAGGQFEGSMSTNGTLLNEKTFHQLVERNIRRLQITLEGPQDFHDGPLGRVYPSGRGSFQVIWKHLEMIRATDFNDVKLVLRIHFRPSTLDLVRRLIDKVNRAFWQDRRFCVHFHPVERWGGRNDQHTEVFASQEEKESIRRQLESLLADPRMVSPFDAEKRECFASNPKSLVVMPDGRLCKCTLKFDESEVGRLLPDGRVHINNHLLSAWSIGHVVDLPEAKRCPYKVLTQAGRQLGLSQLEPTCA